MRGRRSRATFAPLFVAIFVASMMPAWAELGPSIGTTYAAANLSDNPTQKDISIWRALLLVYPNIDADYTDSNGMQCHLTYTMSQNEILDGERSFRQYASIANEFSNAEAFIQYDIVHITRPISSLTPLGNNIFWVSPDDTRQELNQYAPQGTYDSVFVLWPQSNFVTGQQIPSKGWGLSISVTDWSNGATYSTIANAPTSLWNKPTVGEPWLHEWLHSVCNFYQNKGYPMPSNDADGADRHGYVCSPTAGWASYYRDLMTGHVLENGDYKGITADAWRSGAILNQKNKILADYFYTDTTANYQKSGTVAWQDIPATEQYIALGTSVTRDNRMYLTPSLSNQLIVTGRVYIPSSGIGAYDSVSLALRNPQVEYWGILLYGTGLPANMKNTISISRNDIGQTYYPLALNSGWYTIKMLLNYQDKILQVKAWADGTNEPAWQVSYTLDSGWAATQVGFRHYGQGTRVDDLNIAAIIAEKNNPPNIPSMPCMSNICSAKASGIVDTSYSFSTSTTDPDGDQVKYTFDWDYGTTPSSTWLLNSGTIGKFPHDWSKAGTYQVRAKAMDSKGASSDWSDPLIVTITNPPAKPPEITDIIIIPENPTTTKDVTFEAKIKEVPEYEIHAINWHIINAADKSEDYSSYGYDLNNPMTYKPIGPAYGRKKVLCEIFYRNIDTGEIGGPVKFIRWFNMFFDKGKEEKIEIFGARLQWKVDWANDDGGNEPNWYKYWKKDGVIPEMDKTQYDPGDDYNLHNGVTYGYFNPNNNRVCLCKYAATSWLSPIVLNTAFGSETFFGSDKKGIDVAGDVIKHELFHQEVNGDWSCVSDPKGPFCSKPDHDRYLQAKDCDDRLPDYYEEQISKTSNDDTDTYDLEKLKAPEYRKYGDQEYMAMRAGRDAQVDGTKDWANPGKQTSGISYLKTSVASSIGNYLAKNLSITEIAGGYSDSGIDINNNLLYDYLRVKANINISNAAGYKIVAWLNDTHENIITSADNIYYFKASGVHIIDINFDGMSINRHGIDGPYNLSMKMYSLLGESGEATDSKIDVYSTAPYKYADFEGQQGLFTRVYTDSAIDGNSDRIYEGLLVNIGVRTHITGNFTVEGYLFGSNNQTIAFGSNSRHLIPGVQEISINFNGSKIAQSKLNGPYLVKCLSLYDQNGTKLDFVSTAYNTSSYEYTDFLLSKVQLSDSYSSQGIDNNDDGYYEYLRLGVNARVNNQGNYTIVGILCDSYGNEAIEVKNATYLNLGEQEIFLKIPGESIYKQRVNGTLNLTNLWIYDNNGKLMDNAYRAYTTQSINHLDFTPCIRLTGNYSDYAKDIDDDGIFDLLIINIGVIPVNSGNYIATAKLVSEDAKEIACSSSTAWLEAGGQQFMRLNFDGKQIYGHRCDGIYYLKDVYIYHSSDLGYSDYAQDAYITAAYSYVEFKSPQISISGIKFNDINGNGSRDSGEPGIPGWEIRLEQPIGTKILTKITSANGSYILDNISSGYYWITEGSRPGWNQTYPSESSYYVSVEGQNITGCNFGNQNMNVPPDKPYMLMGPTSGHTFIPYNYSVSTSDPNYEQVMFTFNWGDGTTNETKFVSSDAITSLSHSWCKAGTYSVKVKAMNSREASSNWSNPITVKISANNWPSVPSVPTGPAFGKAGSTYSYSTSAKDPDGDKVMYTFDWDDGTKSDTGLVSSGATSSSSHAWSLPGTYNVKSRATDSKGASSGWSSPKSVKVDPNSQPAKPTTPKGPSSGRAGDPYSYSTSAKDPDGDKVLYTFDWGDGTNSSTNLVSSGAASRLSHTWASAGIYNITAKATDRKGASSIWSDKIAVTIKPDNPPVKPTTPKGPATGKAGDSYSYSTSAKDPDGDKVLYTFDWNDGTHSNTSLLSSGASSTKSHVWAAAGNYNVTARATDSKGASSIWSDALAITIKPNNPPAIPAVPSGTKSGNTGIAYTYSTSSKDPDGDTVKYTFDWGDGNTTDTKLATSGTKSGASHIWIVPGSYNVTAKATDRKGASSDLSGQLAVNITSRPPARPSTISGPSTGYAGMSYSYSTSSKDPDGDTMKYTFDWGDGTSTEVGFLSSGTKASTSHSWSTAKTYAVKVKATDINGAISAWSASKSVKISVPRYRNSMATAGSLNPANISGINGSSNASDPSFWYSQGESLLDQGDCSKSLQSFEKALSLNQELAPAWNGKGVSLAILGRLNESCESYGRALLIDQGYADAWYNKGLVLYDLGRYNESAECFDRAISLDPGDDGSWYEKSISLKALGNETGSQAALAKAVELGFA